MPAPSEVDRSLVYHYVRPAEMQVIRKKGLCSPRKLYEEDEALFKEYSFPLYAAKAAKVLNKAKSALTARDVIEYLDNREGPLTSKTLFFTFLPLHFYEKQIQEAAVGMYEIIVRVKTLHQYPPIIVGLAKSSSISEPAGGWDHVLSEQFTRLILDQLASKSGKKIMGRTPYLAVNAFHIPNTALSYRQVR